ncbi:peptidase [Brachybacterium sp. P6-10-X1]|uniref:M23 family metallopeptidase n=1 Tax=Brachybacterium sp. P6-10-X1 TaxID=1903186 RepID=UPI0009717BC1|nr:M23 family metallopeptidase [Brachybacterium sp. P6-10-X1]APX32079.1 peptidase [Brachybacterium sp. P6-10-X1]
MTAPLLLGHPGHGRWLVQNSPADRVPSHGISLLALDHSIDLVPADDRGRTAPVRLRSLVAPEPPEAFPGFGRELLAPLDGEVVAAHDGEPDHPARRGLPSVGYALTQRRRLADGWAGLAGNHVILRATAPRMSTHDGAPGDPADTGASGDVRVVYLALCHLRRGSLVVRPGQRVAAGERLAGCGNSGNSTEPHLHLQAMTAADPSAAGAVAITFPGGLPRNGTVLDMP